MRFLNSIAHGLNTLRDIPALLFRLLLAYGFFYPFLYKFQNPSGFAEMLASLHYPAPEVLAWGGIIAEGLGVILLFFGFATRLITIPLMVMMVLAIITVHWDNGYSCADNGFAIPLMYLLILFSLFITGPGKISIDAICARAGRPKPPAPPHSA